MSAAYITPTYPDMSRWHDPANDCPNRAAFLDQLLGRRAAVPVEPEPEPRRCACGCGKALGAHLRESAKYASKPCALRGRYKAKSEGVEPRPSVLKNGGQCRKCGSTRLAGQKCRKCQSEARKKYNATYQAKRHPAILPSGLDAVEVQA